MVFSYTIEFTFFTEPVVNATPQNHFIPHTAHQYVHVLNKVFGLRLKEDIEASTRLSLRHLQRLIEKPSQKSHVTTTMALHDYYSKQKESKNIQTAVSPIYRSIQKIAEEFRGKSLLDALIAPDEYLRIFVEKNNDALAVGEAYFSLAKIEFIRSKNKSAHDCKEFYSSKESSEKFYRLAIEFLDGINKSLAITLVSKAKMSIFAMDYDSQNEAIRAEDEKNISTIQELSMVDMLLNVVEQQRDNISAARMGMVVSRILKRPDLVRYFLNAGIAANPEFSNFDKVILAGVPAINKDPDLSGYLKDNEDIWSDVACW
jgi:hypothetical protein